MNYSWILILLQHRYRFRYAGIEKAGIRINTRTTRFHNIVFDTLRWVGRGRNEQHCVTHGTKLGKEDMQGTSRPCNISKNPSSSACLSNRRDASNSKIQHQEHHADMQQQKGC